MRANERTDERVAQYLRLDSWFFQTTVHRMKTRTWMKSLTNRFGWRFHAQSRAQGTEHEKKWREKGAQGCRKKARKREKRVIVKNSLTPRTVVWKNQESRRKYWATRSSVRSFARTAHSLACSGLLASLAPSAALTHSLARSLTSLTPSLVGK